MSINTKVTNELTAIVSGLQENSKLAFNRFNRDENTTSFTGFKPLHIQNMNPAEYENLDVNPHSYLQDKNIIFIRIYQFANKFVNELSEENFKTLNQVLDKRIEIINGKILPTKMGVISYLFYILSLGFLFSSKVSAQTKEQLTKTANELAELKNKIKNLIQAKELADAAKKTENESLGFDKDKIASTDPKVKQAHEFFKDKLKNLSEVDLKGVSKDIQGKYITALQEIIGSFQNTILDERVQQETSQKIQKLFDEIAAQSSGSSEGNKGTEESSIPDAPEFIPEAPEFIPEAPSQEETDSDNSTSNGGSAKSSPKKAALQSSGPSNEELLNHKLKKSSGPIKYSAPTVSAPLKEEIEKGMQLKKMVKDDQKPAPPKKDVVLMTAMSERFKIMQGQMIPSQKISGPAVSKLNIPRPKNSSQPPSPRSAAAQQPAKVDGEDNETQEDWDCDND